MRRSLKGWLKYAGAVFLGLVAAVHAQADTFDQDRQAILAMAGDYKVDFRFIETLGFVKDYDIKAPYTADGDEIVRVIEDSGDKISLQHILVVGKDEKHAVKHWRQDWIYQPRSMVEYRGGEEWARRDIKEEDRKGAWLQAVYQVDDSPRYAAVARWVHKNGVSSWTSPATWRPLPRRELTKRHDYDVMSSVNRHVITPWGWAHEQDNTKLMLRDGAARPLAREAGVNRYVRARDVPVNIAETYWRNTADYWALVRADWAKRTQAPRLSIAKDIADKPLYAHLLGFAKDRAGGKLSADEAFAKADAAINAYVTPDLTHPGN